MMSIKISVQAFLAICVLSVISIASASAATFLAHPNSGTFPLLILALAQGPQVLHFIAGNVECKHYIGHGIAETLQSASWLLTESYSGCVAFGLAAKVTTAKFLFTANGLASLENTVTWTALGCTITFPSSKNQNLEKILYLNTGNDLLIHSEINGLTSSGTGAACSYAEESQGTLRGLALIFADGGSLDWDP